MAIDRECSGSNGLCDVCLHPLPPVGTIRNCGGASHRTHVEVAMPARSAPGFLEKVRNFASAAAGHVAAGMPMCDDAEIIRRHDICLACEHLVNDACTQCGCPVARVRGYVSKLSWADQECPVGKWGRAPSA